MKSDIGMKFGKRENSEKYPKTPNLLDRYHTRRTGPGIAI